MTLFLARVRDAEEARIALAGGADIVDVAGSAADAPGASDIATAAAVVAIAGGRSGATCGDTRMEPAAVAAAARALAGVGVAYIGLGMVPGRACDAHLRALAPLARGAKYVGVVFADGGVDVGLIAAMAEAGFAGAMLITADDGWLCGRLDLSALAGFVEACHRHGLLAGLAGGLEPPDIPRLLALRPDFLGFRKALHPANGDTVDAGAIAAVRDLIPSLPAGAALPDDGHAAADQAPAPAAARDGATDRIFVHDFVLPMSIGAYARERDAQQRVRFNVDIDIERRDHIRDDVRDVLSYDIVTDGIRMLVARGHLVLVETLAEQIAELVLAQPRAVRAIVRVEKLDVGPGSVGVEIRRERPVPVRH